MSIDKLRSSECIILFNSVHRIIKAEKVLKELKLNVRLIPLPRSLSSDCGFALMTALEELGRIKEVLESKKIKIYQIYVKRGEEYILHV